MEMEVEVSLLPNVLFAIVFILIGVIVYVVFIKKNYENKCSKSTDKNKNSNTYVETNESKLKNKNQQNEGKKLSAELTKKNPTNLSVKEINISHPLLIASLKGHTSTVLDIDFSNNGKYLASCSEGIYMYISVELV